MARVRNTSARLGRFVSRHSRIVKSLVAVAVVLVLVVIGANAYVLLSTRGEAADRIADVPRTQTAIVLGAFVNPNGKMSLMLRDRVHEAAELWRSGKVKRILVSGDHGSWKYDEPDTMRFALLRQGVPAPVIFTDHAGFNTWATMVRAKKVFDVKSAVVITQKFHMGRALFLADAAGLDATGLTSNLHGYGVKGDEADLREVLARVKAVGDATLDTGVLLGPEIPITGDGRASWGPAPPPGTPPAGAPRT